MAKKIIFTIFSLIITTIMASAQSKFTLVIDAGHGGHDVGAKGAFSYEKDINLKVSLAFGKYVEKYCQDVKVVYTRKTDVFIPLHERADIANKAKANLFISVHTNALPKGRIARGFESYTLGMHRAKDNLDVAQRENSVILVEKDYKTRYEGFDPNSSESYIMFEFIQDKNMAKSVNFATLVQNEVCNGANRPNKGVKQAGFLVLRETTMPSCLIELGFITTPDEEQLLNNEQRIDEISRAIFNAFQQYKKKETGGSVAPLKVSKPEFSVNTPVTSSANTSRTQNNNSNVSSSSNKGDNASGNQQKTGTQQQARNSNSQVQNAPEKKSTSVVPRNTQEERRKANEQAKKKAEEEARKKVADNAKKKAIEDNKKKEEAKKEADKAKNKTASDTKKATPEIKNQGNAASKNTTKKNKDADDVKPRAQMKREQTNKGLASNATKNKEIPNKVSTSASTSMTSVQSQRQTTQRQTIQRQSTQQTAQQRNNTTTATTQTQRSAVVTQNSTPSQQGTVSTAKPNQQLAQSEQKKAETVTVRSTEAATNTKTEPVIQQTQAKPQNSVQASKPSETPQKKIASVATTQNAQQNQPVVPAKKETTPAKIETGNNVAKTTPQQPQKTEAAVQKADVQAKSNETETSMPVFKVQVVASREQLKADDARLMGEKDFSYYEEGDFYKYTIGNSTNYDEMGKTRQSLLDKFPGAFIVAFKDGKKINTAEAVREFRQNKK